MILMYCMKLGDDCISISCEFLVENDIIVIDSTVKTNLNDEYLYNESGMLEICMKSDGENQSFILMHFIHQNLKCR